MTDTIRLIIAGSRDFDDYKLLEKEVDQYLYREIVVNHYPDLTEEIAVIEIVSGGARGADRLGEKYAENRGLPVKKFIPDWNGKGKSAGYLRNEEMANYGNYCICFNINRSKGSAHMENMAKKHSLGLKVVNIPVPAILPKPTKKYIDISRGIKEE